MAKTSVMTPISVEEGGKPVGRVCERVESLCGILPSRELAVVGRGRRLTIGLGVETRTGESMLDDAESSRLGRVGVLGEDDGIPWALDDRRVWSEMPVSAESMVGALGRRSDPMARATLRSRCEANCPLPSEPATSLPIRGDSLASIGSISLLSL